MTATCPAGHTSASDDYCEVCGLPISAAPSLTLAGPPAAADGSGGVTASGAAVPGGPVPGGQVPGGQCPHCAAPRSGNFCESCGYDFASPDPVTLDPAVFRSAPPLTGPLPTVPAVQPPAPAPVQAPAPLSASQPATVQAEQLRSAPPAAAAEWTAVVSADRAYYDEVQAVGGPDAADIEFPVYVPQRRFKLTGAEVRIGRHSTSSGIDPEIDLSVPPADPGVSRLHAVLLRSTDGSYCVVDPGSANGTAVNGIEIPQGKAVPLTDGDRIHLGAWTELRVVRDA